jgi:heptosyltransferase-3
MQTMKTLVYHDGGLGDMLLSLPCLERIKSGSGWVHLVGRGDVSRFLKDAGLVDAAAASDQALFASLYSAIDPRLRTLLSGFDRACIFTREEYAAAAAAIHTVIPHTITIRTIPPDGSQMHAARYRLSQLEPAAALPIGYAFLNVPPEKTKAARSLLSEAGSCQGRGLIAIHPGSGGSMKCWPLERYIELIERLQSVNDAFVIVFTGEAEDGELRKAVERYARGRKNLLHAADLDLMSAAAVLSLCGLYIGNDSGFSHLAGTLGCSAIVLFGPTDPLRWKPVGPHVEAVSTTAGGPMTQITVDNVIVRIESAIAARAGR